MTDKEIDQAMGALISWFQSQNISPRDGALIMTRLMAAQFVLKTRDANELQDALDLQTLLLATEMAGFLAAAKCRRSS
jgi:hypothetical protein